MTGYPAIRLNISDFKDASIADGLLVSIREACRQLQVSCKIETQDSFMDSKKCIVVMPTSADDIKGFNKVQNLLVDAAKKLGLKPDAIEVGDARDFR